MSHWSPAEWATFLGSIVAVVTAISSGLIAVIKALHNVSEKVVALTVQVDGRLDELLRQTAQLAHAEGLEAGRGTMIVPDPDYMPVRLPREDLPRD